MDAPAVAGSEDGKALFLAWRARDGDPDVYWASIPEGFGGKPQSFPRLKESPLSSTTAGRQTHPAVALDGQGTAIFAWEDTRPGWQAIAAATSRTGTRNLLVSERSQGKASFPAVAGGKTQAVVVYEAGGDVHLRSLDPGSPGRAP